MERAQAGALDGADMHEHVVAAIVGLNEAEAFCRVEPLNCSGSHLTSPRLRTCANARTTIRASLDPISAMSWGVEPVRRDQQANRLFEWGGVYAPLDEIASETGRHDKMLIKRAARRINPAG